LLTFSMLLMLPLWPKAERAAPRSYLGSLHLPLPQGHHEMKSLKDTFRHPMSSVAEGQTHPTENSLICPNVPNSSPKPNGKGPIRRTFQTPCVTRVSLRPSCRRARPPTSCSMATQDRSSISNGLSALRLALGKGSSPSQRS
jgi:hypothetical protein